MNIKRESYSYVLFLLFLILPSTVFLKELSLEGDLSLYPGVHEGQRVFDIFAFYKGQLLSWGAPFALGLYLWGNPVILSWRKYRPLLLMLAGLLVSTLFSPWKPLPFSGSPELFETAWVWLSYMILFFLTWESAKNVQFQRRLFTALFIGLIPLMLVSLLQLIGKDPFQFLWVKRLILPAKLHEYMDNFSFHKDAHEVYSTIGNPNYVGSLVPLLLPLPLHGIFQRKPVLFRVGSTILLIVLVVILLGSRSRAGYVGCVGLLFSGWFFYRRTLPRVVNIVIPLGMFCLVTLGVSRLVQSEERFRSVISQLEVTDSTFEMYTENDGVKLKVVDGELLFYNKKGEGLNMYSIPSDPGRYLVKEKGYEDFSFRFKTKPADHIIVAYRGFHFIFYIIKGEFKVRYYDGSYRPLSVPRRLPFLDSYEHLASDRVYIWSRSIPMLWKEGILGSGADTYPRVFPQDDFYGKFRVYDTQDIIVTKPHNLFLQIAITLGFITLVGFLWLLIGFYKNSIKLIDNSREQKAILLIPIAMGVSGYLCAALFNDSSVAVAPYFWVLLGLGMGLSNKIKKEQQQ